MRNWTRKHVILWTSEVTMEISIFGNKERRQVMATQDVGFLETLAELSI
jgi:hypothetical protein